MIERRTQQEDGMAFIPQDIGDVLDAPMWVSRARAAPVLAWQLRRRVAELVLR